MLPEFNIKKIDSNLFADTAEKIARELANDKLINSEKKRSSDLNKPTQIRKFYDEVVIWHNKVGNDKNIFDNCLPFIKMIGSKVAYSKGREYVGDFFQEFVNKGLKQIETLEEFNNFKLLFEAVLGYYKALRPK